MLYWFSSSSSSSCSFPFLFARQSPLAFLKHFFSNHPSTQSLLFLPLYITFLSLSILTFTPPRLLPSLFVNPSPPLLCNPLLFSFYFFMINPKQGVNSYFILGFSVSFLSLPIHYYCVNYYRIWIKKKWQRMKKKGIYTSILLYFRYKVNIIYNILYTLHIKL